MSKEFDFGRAIGKKIWAIAEGWIPPKATVPNLR